MHKKWKNWLNEFETTIAGLNIVSTSSKKSNNAATAVSLGRLNRV